MKKLLNIIIIVSILILSGCQNMEISNQKSDKNELYYLSQKNVFSKNLYNSNSMLAIETLLKKNEGAITDITENTVDFSVEVFKDDIVTELRLSEKNVKDIRSFSNDKILLILENALCIIDKNGKEIKKISKDFIGNAYFVIDSNNDIISHINEGHGDVIEIYDGNTLVCKSSDSFLNDRIWFNGHHGLFYYDSGSLMEYTSDRKDTMVIDFSELDIDYEKVVEVERINDSVIVVCNIDENYEIYVLTNDPDKQMKNQKDTEEREQLNFLSINSFQGDINEFNKSSRDYVVKASMVSQEQYEAQVIADKPNIIELRGEATLEAFINKGYLLDLSSYIEKSDCISINDFHDSVKKNLSDNNTVYTIPKEMGLLTLIGPSRICEEYKSWSVDDFLNVLEKNPNAFSYNDRTIAETKSYILRVLLYGLVEDRDEFNFEELRGYIERINKLEITTSGEDVATRLQDGEIVLLKKDNISTPDALSNLESKTGVELSILGFPSYDEENGHSIVCFDKMLGIIKDTKNPAGAWQFVEEYFNKPTKCKGTFISTKKDEFEQMLLIGTDREKVTIDNVVYMPVTEKDILEIKKAYDNSIYFSNKQMEMVDIIEEEASHYYNADKSIDDVMDIIKSRVTIMIRENA